MTMPAKSWSGVFRPLSAWYEVGPEVDGRLRVVDAGGERWIEATPATDKHAEVVREDN